VKPTSVEMGSICGGGRYDNLTGVFGLSGVSGVGISFGVDRIYDVLSELQLYPIKSGSSVDVLVANFGGETLAASLEILNLIRERGLNAEIYPTTSKMKKQFNYADKKGIKNVLIIGDEELKHGLYGLKNMESGEQKKYDKESLLDALFTCR
jgi:histidyl-tRNA synthetase